MLGTDHPFFPPLQDEDEKWPSVTSNYKAIQSCFGDEKADSIGMVLGSNANHVLKLGLE